ncbi:MAG TPA: GTPase Era [Terriglobales bacterium]|nr:GTPase Era [Terriglobales bacterium]
MSEGAFHSGFVTLVGRPNTGKSTLANALVGKKVAAVTPHPQTTRTHLLGVVNVTASSSHPAGQIVLVDTPGVHRGRGHLSREMLRSVRAGLEGRDLSLLLADVTRAFGAEDQMALDLLRMPGAPPVFLVLNKVDLLPQREALLPQVAAWKERFAFAEVIPISALRKENLDRLVEQMLAYLPPGPVYFPPEQTTDQPEKFLIAEVIREQAMLLTREEVPHTLAVLIEGDQRRQRATGPLRVLQAAIYCERPGQKSILIGRGGEMIRKIGTAARQQLEASLGTAIFLELHVLVRESWRENPRFVAGLDFRRG